ncbi:MAG TPA: histidinol dehydrogenase [Fimbriimonadaceae bacterium]|nr:histidinol dehydrogenase [Fimbriimonadaceae bacterium]
MSIKILKSSEAETLLSRKAVRMAEAEETVKPILEAVRARGDAALFEYARKFDGLDGSLIADPAELEQAAVQVSLAFRQAVETSMANIRAFAALQMPREFRAEVAPGHVVGQIVRPLDTIAAYIPGGRYPLPSTVLMTAIPAAVAGVPNIWVTTPKANRETYAAAAMAGVRNLARLGGAQAIAAFAFGTDTIPRADRIVGPGNIYVTAAKKLLAGEVGIDFIAGPTEVLIVANEGNPAWIAADMLAQAEHDADAAALLLTTSPTLADAVSGEIEKQLETLSTAAAARLAIANNSAIILTESDDESIELSNRVAPEHLCLHDPALLSQIRHAGSVFLGAYSPEAAGDYSTGPNHVLPTAGAGRLHGGLSVQDFVKVVTIQELSPEALQSISGATTTLARAEGLEGHARSIEARSGTGVPPVSVMAVPAMEAPKALRAAPPYAPSVEHEIRQAIEAPKALRAAQPYAPSVEHEIQQALEAPKARAAFEEGERGFPKPRQSVQGMRPYSPPTGGRHESLRLDFNENTVGCSPRVAEFLRKTVTGDVLATYPDYEEARRDLAAFFGVENGQMLLTNGTDEAIQVLVNTFVEPGDEVLILTPSYAMYRFYAEVAGAEIVEIPYRAGDLAFELQPVLNAITQKTKAILLSNPNNPTGTAIPESDLEVVLQAAPAACVLVDEAYFEFYGQAMLARIAEFDNLFVSRTFSKAYGMAAMRMGCLFSCERNAAAMRKAQSPYSVNMLAALAAREAIQDQEFTKAYVASALEGRSQMEAVFEEKGIRHWPSEANFILFDAGTWADECLAKCREQGILIRDRRHEIPGALRVTAGPPNQMKRFVDLLAQIAP